MAAADYEYREGEALQDGDKGQVSGFHVLRLDFETERQASSLTVEQIRGW